MKLSEYLRALKETNTLPIAPDMHHFWAGWLVVGKSDRLDAAIEAVEYIEKQATQQGAE